MIPHPPTDASSLTLGQLIIEARREFAAELAIPLTAHDPPSYVELETDPRCPRHGLSGQSGEPCRHCTPITREDPAPQIGRPMSARMYRFLRSPARYGLQYEIAGALWQVNQWCRRRHWRWPDHKARPPREAAIGQVSWHLCGRLLRIVVMRTPAMLVAPDDLVRAAAAEEGLQLPRAARLVDVALREAWEIRSQMRRGETGVA